MRWRAVPAGVRRLKIEDVPDQPEASGGFSLSHRRLAAGIAAERDGIAWPRAGGRNEERAV
jgi:hypothetical protein